MDVIEESGQCWVVTTGYLVNWLRPHPLQVGGGGLVDVDGGAVLKRLPLGQVTVRLHRRRFPEVPLTFSGLAVAPLLRV